jgi:curved DNA-binding protein CbpA
MNADINYYRILQVQPDAPPEVIRHNYTILLKKLRIHPDLGGNDIDAALINVAYETLRHPERRAEYDQLLLKQNNLLPISQRHIARPAFFSEKPKQYSAATKEKNQRNYYRILQVHPDAHATVIRERYMALSTKSELPQDLLDEAYYVLNNLQKRGEYDRLLKIYKHAIAVKKMEIGNVKENKNIRLGDDDLRDECGNYSGYLSHLPDLLTQNTDAMIYAPIITRYCAFCKTPYTLDRENKYKTLCLVCDSPLFSPPQEIAGKVTRTLDRIKRSGNIIFYVYWPSQKLPGYLFDISPKGLRFKSDFGLDAGQIIKIEGEKFKAVAEVIHSQVEDKKNSIGVCFRTILFNCEKGNFLVTSV